MNDLSFIRKLTSGKRKYVCFFLTLIAVLAIYFIINTHKISYIMVIDSDKSSATDYSNVHLDSTLVKLPFDYLFIYGSIQIDDQEMKIGKVNTGNYQIIRDNNKYDISMYFYNPKIYRNDYKENRLNIDRGYVYLSKKDEEMKYFYADMFIIRNNLSTTTTESFTISGKLVDSFKQKGVE